MQAEAENVFIVLVRPTEWPGPQRDSGFSTGFWLPRTPRFVANNSDLPGECFRGHGKGKPDVPRPPNRKTTACSTS